MSSRVKVSIVVPVYNVEQYLRECLDSLINQTLEDIEIICVNDGSTDGSLSILREYESNDSRVKVIDKPNAGYGQTMNVGMDVASGEYVGFVDSDDCVATDMYERLYQIAKQEDLELIKADFYRYFHDDNGEPIYKKARLCPEVRYYNKIFSPCEILETFDFIMHTWTGIYKRDFLLNNKIRYNETPGASFQDSGFFFQTFAWAQKAYFLNEYLYKYRSDNPNSSINSKNKVFCIRDEYEFIKSFLDNNPIIKEKLIGVYWVLRYGSYKRAYNRLSNEFKLLFIKHFADIFNKAKESKELDRKLFNKNKWSELCDIMDNPIKYNNHILDTNRRKYLLKNKNKKSIVMLMRRTFWCFQDHGIKYTTKLLFSKIKEKIAPSWSYLSSPNAHIKIIFRKFLKAVGLSKLNKTMRSFENIKDCHNGERCFITCTGPSLRLEDIESLKGEYTIGVNTIFLAYDHTEWRPTYYAVVDPYICRRYSENYSMDFDSFSKCGAFLHSQIKVKESEKVKKSLIHYGNHTKNNMAKNQIKIEEDISVCVYDCFTVTNMAINLAIYMGFKKIYIIGADCNFEGKKIHFIPNSFDPNSEKKGRWKKNVDRSINGYKAMKNFAETRGVKIYNATRGGFLEVFERVDFDSIEKKKHTEI